MREIQACPDHETLVGWNAGALTGNQFETVCDHIERCKDCQHAVDQMEDRSIIPCQQLSGITAGDLARASKGIEADAPTAQVVSSWLGELKNARDAEFVPTLKVPCELRQYEVESLLGYGGMGEVYKAQHKSLKRPVALKVMRSTRQDDPVAQAHFLREIETAGQLDHPNLVRAHDAWEQDGFVFLAQELLDGDSLRWLAKEGQIKNASEILSYLESACRGVEQLHARGFVHRDIKPANIMRLRDGTIKLIDYGLAVPADADQGTDSPQAGTLGYMAPEQAGGSGTIDQRSDIYSLGCVLKYLLRHLPTGSATVTEGALRKALESLSCQMTQPKPEDRPPSIEAVNRRLEQIKGHQGGSVGTSKPWYFTQWSASVLALLLLTGPAVYLIGRGSIFNEPKAPPSPTDTTKNPVQVPFQLRMVDIPAGQFVMGGVPGDSSIRSNESPQRTVTIADPFRMSAHEVTVGQFREFVAATRYETEAERSGKGGWLANRSTSYGKQNPDFNWSKPGYLVSDNLPVTMVTHADAMAYCEWLSIRDQRSYRLPTEAEWEYCCRAGTSEIHPFPANRIDEYVWSLQTVGEYVAPRPVGTRQANPWGLYDMIGNVREWCQDWYSEGAYRGDPVSFPAGPTTGELRVIRGGCFMDMAAFFRASHRGYLAPGAAVSNQGFRIVEKPAHQAKSSTAN